jgi:hypothetical protein
MSVASALEKTFRLMKRLYRFLWILRLEITPKRASTGSEFSARLDP